MNKNERELIREYLDDCRQRLSPYTVKNHKATLKALEDFQVNLCDKNRYTKISQ
jgi:hypothetical protein